MIVEDIVDTGLTLRKLQEYFLESGAASVRLCALISKPARRRTDVVVDYIGFVVPDEFIVGYGMDYAGKYRNLPDVCSLS